MRISSFWDMVERERGWCSPPSDMPAVMPHDPALPQGPHPTNSRPGEAPCCVLPACPPPGLVFPLPGVGGGNASDTPGPSCMLSCRCQARSSCCWEEEGELWVLL